MHIYVYEHLTAGGDVEAPASLLVEGAAMFAAVAADFGMLPEVEVVRRIDDGADATLVIAPETGGLLTSIVAAAERTGCRLLSPSSSFCSWASDKSQVAATMQSAGVPMPRGVLLESNDPLTVDFPFPAVLKPNDGCGSQGVRIVGNALRGVPHAGRNATEGVPYKQRLEQFVPGLATSVALLRGPAGIFPLPACEQRLADDGTFAYRGGSCPLPPAFAARAEALARRAAAAMPEWRGYIGVDLVLGPADDGSQDYLIEVNPRLTTSYVGLRALSETNLAAAMLDVVAGREPRLAFRAGKVEFAADGTVSYA